MSYVKFLTMGMFVVISSSVIAASAESAKDEFIVRKTSEQVVLYTIYRGSYDKAGESIGKLFALAGQKGLIPCGSPSFAYLNNLKLVAPEHCITEIRVPVKAEALKAAGTLGPFTDVKKMPPMEVVVAQKPEGMADPANLYEQLNIWIAKHGYVMNDSSWETFFGNGMGGGYAQMKSEITVPVAKLTKKESVNATSRQEKKN